MIIELVGNSKHPSKEAVGTEVVAPLWKSTHPEKDRQSRPATKSSPGLAQQQKSK
jgi:hypothetical protein